MAVEIVRLHRQELAQLEAFLKVAYPDEQRKNLPYLDWYFLQNPNAPAERLPLWVAKSEGKVVGQVATIPIELKVASSLTNAIWILEFILLPEFRGQGLGKRLVQKAGEEYPTMITLGINEASTRVFTSLGWRPLGEIHRYHRMLFAGSAAATSPLVRRGLDLLTFPIRKLPSLRKPSPRYQIRLENTFGAEMDELWDRASRQWPATVRRECKYLTWQFSRQPAKCFEVLKLYEREKLVGYAVLFFRKGQRGGPPPKAAISDLLYDASNADEIINELLNAALTWATERRAGSLVTDVLDAKVEASLKEHGFWRIQKSPHFMAFTTRFQDTLYRPENWYLTRADSDVSIFEEPNA